MYLEEKKNKNHDLEMLKEVKIFCHYWLELDPTLEFIKHVDKRTSRCQRFDLSGWRESVLSQICSRNIVVGPFRRANLRC